MPRWASRITLEITNIRVERLQEITAADAKAEGMTSFFEQEYKAKHGHFPVGIIDSVCDLGTFKRLWDQINGKKHPWASNPWVWVVEFVMLTTDF